ncbi:hypothetical protein [Burkholderia gladioli]|nr:hypothetical protein [Burkholderia gladioli]
MTPHERLAGRLLSIRARFVEWRRQTDLCDSVEGLVAGVVDTVDDALDAI